MTILPVGERVGREPRLKEYTISGGVRKEQARYRPPGVVYAVRIWRAWGEKLVVLTNARSFEAAL